MYTPINHGALSPKLPMNAFEMKMPKISHKRKSLEQEYDLNYTISEELLLSQKEMLEKIKE